MTYKRNFLKNVILRIDYTPIDSLVTSTNHHIEFSQLIQERYPFFEKKLINNWSVEVSSHGGLVNSSQQIQWEHREKIEGKKIVALLPSAIIFEYLDNQYSQFSNFLDDVVYIFNKFQSLYNVDNFLRVGLRYINQIEIPGINPLDWQDYINRKLASSITAGLPKEFKLARTMHQLHFKKEEASVLFNYGLFNKDYPNSIAWPEFILDFDCYIQDILPASAILNVVRELNQIASNMFEESIDTKLRQIMEDV